MHRMAGKGSGYTMANARFSAVEQAQSAPDYARYDRIWQRVAPAMNPYPEARAVGIEQRGSTQERSGSMDVSGGSTLLPQQNGTVTQELMLPGAAANPCCLGTGAQDMTAVVEGFAQEEAADGTSFFQLSRMAPSRAQCAALREMGQSAARRARELLAVFYLITGELKQNSGAAVVLPRLTYRELLRQRYHDTACNALNYARAKDGTVDPCLQRIFMRFAEESYAEAERILKLLAQLP